MNKEPVIMAAKGATRDSLDMCAQGMSVFQEKTDDRFIEIYA